MQPSIKISSITFNDNTTIELSDDQILLIVGPNNSGKSVFLRQIVAYIRNKDQMSLKNKIITDLSFKKKGNIHELRGYIEKNSIYKDQIFSLYKRQLHISEFGNWENDPGKAYNFSDVFISLSNTTNRLEITNPTSSISMREEQPSHPIHFLYKNAEKEKEFCNYFKEAFNQDLVVHRMSGRIIPTYIGRKPKKNIKEDETLMQYYTEVEQQMMRLEEQGDGMRSFVGVLLDVFIQDYSINLIDEPEAFLHPPQAKILGRMLCKNIQPEKQLIIATHSSDFIKGIIETNTDRLKIIRMERDGHINRISELNSEDLKALWSDPLIKHSNIIDAVFHSAVIICEADTDCSFYSAILNSLCEHENKPFPDVLFTYSGGKDRIPVIARAIKKLNVRIKVIADFDMIKNTDNKLKELYEALGGDWLEISSDVNCVVSSINNKRPELKTAELKKVIDEIFENTNTEIFPIANANQIKKHLKKISAWEEAKNNGISYIPSAAPSIAYKNLKIKLEEKRIFILEVGEMECFYKSVGNHGTKWLNEVLTKDLINDPELEEARKFVQKIIEA